MAFTSLEEIKTKFNIDGSDMDEMRTLLNKERVSLHPDKNKGEFISNTEKERFELINQAIDFIDQNKVTGNNYMIPFSEVKELVEHLTKQINKESLTSERKLSEKIDSNIVNFKSRFLFPNISSTTITLILSFIFMFPSQIQSHPVLSIFIDIESQMFILVWIISLIITIELWTTLFLRENKNKEILTKVKTVTWQNMLFKNFNRRREKFSREDLLEYILDKTNKGYKNNKSSLSYRKTKNMSKNSILIKVTMFMIIPFSSFSPFYHSNIFYMAMAYIIIIPTILSIYLISRDNSFDIDIAEELTNAIILRAEEKGVITKNNYKSMSDTYRLIE